MKKIIYSLLLGIVFFACKDPYGDEIFRVSTDQSAAQAIKEGVVTEDGVVLLDKDDFTLWTEILEYSNMYNTLNLAGDYTCFVPNNDAVSAFLQEQGYSSITSMSKDFAENLVKYHTVAQKSYLHTDFSNGLIADTTASGDYLNITIGDAGIASIYVNDRGLLLTVDIDVTNGVLHTMDKVLIPIEGSIYENLLSNSEYKIFTDALEATGYNEILSTIYNYDEDGNRSVSRYTVFAVKNSQFYDYGISNVDQLAVYLGASNDYKSEDNGLNQFMAYHILPQMYSYSDLYNLILNFDPEDDEDVDDESVISLNMNTLYGEGLISIAEANKTLYVNYLRETGTGLKFLEINWNTKNGVIHTMDDIMDIIEPDYSTSIFEFTDYNSLANYLSSSDLNYRVTTNEGNIHAFLPVDAVTPYVWYNPNSAMMNQSVSYYYSGTTNTVGTSRDALYCDYLLLNLGYNGWVEMEIPAIRRGKYKVSITHYNIASTDPKYLNVIIDDVSVGNVALRYALTSAYYTVEVGEVDFTSTKTHKLRLLQTSESTNPNGNSYLTSDYWLDYMIFEPINE